MKKVAILGATGIVGQKLIALLVQHYADVIEIVEVVASSGRCNQSLQDCEWREPLLHLTELPQAIRQLKFINYTDITANIVLSCLPSDIAKDIELFLAERGKVVFSNASAWRLSPIVPLLSPEVNPESLKLIFQQATRGKIITNPNCSVAGLAPAIWPVLTQYKKDLQHISIITLQSVSGAGYPGVSSLDIMNNIIPHIAEEAEKINWELRKICNITQEITMATNVHRVPILYGHSATLHFIFEKSKIIEEKEIRDMYICNPDLFVYHADPQHPNIRDLRHDDMKVHIGNIQINQNILSMNILSHNLVRGAAGSLISNVLLALKAHHQDELDELPL